MLHCTSLSVESRKFLREVSASAMYAENLHVCKLCIRMAYDSLLMKSLLQIVTELLQVDC